MHVSFLLCGEFSYWKYSTCLVCNIFCFFPYEMFCIVHLFYFYFIGSGPRLGGDSFVLSPNSIVFHLA